MIVAPHSIFDMSSKRTRHLDWKGDPRMKRIATLSALAAALVTPQLSCAEEGITPGLAVSIFGSFSHTKTEPDSGSSSTNNTGVVAANLSYYVTPNIEVGAGLGWVGSDGNDATTLSAFLNYHFGTVGGKGNLSPFVGVTAGYLFGEDDNAARYGVYAGAEYFVTERASFGGTIGYYETRFDNSKSKDMPLITLQFKYYF